MRISDWSSDVCSSDVDPRVVRAGADGVVVQERVRLVQVVDHLRALADIGVEHGAAEVERQGHRVAVVVVRDVVAPVGQRSEEHTSELQSLMRISYAVFCLTKKTTQQ